MKIKTYTEEQVNEIDRRRQLQIKNQIGIIDRLLEGDSSYDDEMRVLNETLATTQQDLEAALRRVAELERGMAAAAQKKA